MRGCRLLYSLIVELRSERVGRRLKDVFEAHEQSREHHHAVDLQHPKQRNIIRHARPQGDHGPLEEGSLGSPLQPGIPTTLSILIFASS